MTTRRRTVMSRRQRMLAAAIAFAVCLAGLFSEQHQAAVSHVVCEHGELTHGQAIASTAVAPSTLTTVPAAPGAAHGHEHCALTNVLHAVTQTPHFAIVAQAIETTTPPVLAPDAIASRECIFRTAPKTSPPV